jgi:hypothetical protein
MEDDVTSCTGIEINVYGFVQPPVGHIGFFEVF